MGRRKTNSGETAVSVDVVLTFLSKRQLSDWHELSKDIQNDGKEPGDEHHDNQQ